MAKFTPKFDYTLENDLAGLLQSEKEWTEIVDAAVPVLEDSVKAECSKHRRTGTMCESIKKTRAKKATNGAFIATVRPTGLSTTFIDDTGTLRKRSTPVRNMEIVAHMEYGTSKQPPTPVLSKAINDSKEQVYTVLQKEINKRISK